MNPRAALPPHCECEYPDGRYRFTTNNGFQVHRCTTFELDPPVGECQCQYPDGRWRFLDARRRHIHGCGR